MPSGGGALRGISEPFKSQPFSGGGGFSIPFGTPDARGVAPGITLAYSSGAGNGLFGLGFSVGMDSVMRKTSTGIPRYDDTDVFLLGGGELLPKYNEKNGSWTADAYTCTINDVTWNIVRYVPRVEGGFALIEQWTDSGTRLSYWKVLSADNVTSYYGVTSNGRIADPANPEHIFEWLIEQTVDPHGNKINYNYKAGDTVGIPDTPFNRGRDFTSQRYPDTIQYGNYYINTGNGLEEHFAFEVVFDYGQLNKDNPDAAPTQWTARPDIFSTYKSGFEIRTARLCYGIYLRHFFTGENNGAPFTTTALLPEYDITPHSGLSIIKRVYSRGYKLQSGHPLWIQDSPAAELTYQDFNPLAATWQLLEAEAPGYFNSSGFIPVDLDGLGIDGLLYSTDSFTGYLEPLGNGKFAPMRVLEQFPVFRDLQSGQVTLSSLDGNNVLDLVVNDGVSNGFFEQGNNLHWKPFQSFADFPQEYLSPEKELADLSGTGRSDLFFNEQNALKFYASQGKDGFAPASYIQTPPRFPAAAQGGAEELFGFSDFLGDGLSHRFQLRNGLLTVWPCLGHGHFGEAVEFANAPLVDGAFDASRVFLIDADGSGATDIVYCYPGYAHIWFNQNGNRFSEPVKIIFPGPYSNITAITAGDVSGYGTTSLVFTVADPEVRHWYYDFSNKQKPYLLQCVDNGVGGLSAVTYTTSVLEHLRDKQEGRIWPTRLPIAVSVVSESTTTDQLTGAVYTERYRYHDGYFDPVEREFRGFGYVETWDCETYEQFEASAVLNQQVADLLDKNLWMPPVYSRSWFITGAYEQTPEILAQYETEFYKGDAQQWSIPVFTFDDAMQAQDALSIKQAYAALAGQTIRSEVYAEDNSSLAENPYTVSMSSVLVRLIQPRLGGRYCSLMPVGNNSLSYTYDRNPADPHIAQSLVLSMDEYGNPLLSAAISYPRRDQDDDRIVIYPEQQKLRVVVSESWYINAPNISKTDPPDSWQYLGVGWQGKGYETAGFEAPANAPFTPDALLQLVNTALANPLASGDTPPATQPWSRLLSWSRSVFWNDTGTAAAAYGAIYPQALLHHTETAVLDPEEITAAYGDKVNNTMLTNQCGYVLANGYWWNYGMMQLYNWGVEYFYTPSITKATITGILSATVLDANGFNGSTTVQYDPYYLSITQSTAVLTESISISNTYEYDYQSMSPWRSTDANGNVAEVLTDALGRVIVTSAYGTINGVNTGDLPISEYVIQGNATFDDVLAHPENYLQGASSYFYNDIFAWKNRQQPLNAIGVTRMDHAYELQAEGKGVDETQMPISIAYSDGLGTVLQSKVKTTHGEITLRKIDGVIVNPSPDSSTQERWLVSGRTVYNNKGMPVEQYLPYFSGTPYFEDQQSIIDEQLVPPPSVIHYDPAGRVIRTDSPKGFFSKSVYQSWETHSYDFNDTILDAPYYKWFMENYPATPTPAQQAEYAALQAAVPCYNTPAKVVIDNLGNPIRTIACNLGAIAADTIPEDVAYPDTPVNVWNALLSLNYLAKENEDDTNAWVTNYFQPYTPGFSAQFRSQFPDNGEQLEDWLAQSCMTSLGVYNIQRQQLYNADARLFLKMVREETVLFNFRSEYGFGGQVLKSESADAGLRWNIANIAGNPVCSWDNNGYQAINTYDNLQRPLSLQVMNSTLSPAMNNIVQLTVYGETAPDAAANNLIGKPWKDYDESGLSIIPTYNIAGAALSGTTYLRPDYKTEANWTTQAQQDILNSPSVYNRSTTYNAPGQVLQDTLPDGTLQQFSYTINGALKNSKQKIHNPALPGEQLWTEVITHIDYNATGNRTRVVNGNGVTSIYTYDALTLQIVRSYTTRTGDFEEGNVLQDMYYTYDPVGHTISTIDNNDAVVFNNNQQVLPGASYTYDPLYRIITANGRTMPGLNVPERGGAAVRSLSFPKAGSTSDLQNLENYTEKFTYDFGDNLILKRHIAASGNWTQVFTVQDTNNHLNTMYVGNPSDNMSGLPQFLYDGNGNTLVLNPGSTARVQWNYLNHISNVVTIERTVTDENTGETVTLNDAEYYQYNTSGNRVRKVSERMVNGGTHIEYTEKIYLGGFQQSRTWTAPVNATRPSTPPAPQSEKHTITFNDGNAPALITHVWITAPPNQSEITAGDVQYRYQLCDPLDSVTMEVTETAELLTYEQYYVYGGTAYTIADSQLEADSKELRFCGKERDATTGLYYYGARYYATWTCRWMSPDPAGPVDGPNLYEYVSSNPVRYNDPTGMAGDDSSGEENDDLTGLLGKRGVFKSKSNKKQPKAKKQKTKKEIKEEMDPRAQEIINLLVDLMTKSKATDINGGGRDGSGLYVWEMEMVKPRNDHSLEQRLLRHLSNAIFSKNPKFVEIQSGLGLDGNIYISSNDQHTKLNNILNGYNKLSDFLDFEVNKVVLPEKEKTKSGDMRRPHDKTGRQKIANRQYRHAQKLKVDINEYNNIHPDPKIILVPGIISGKHAEGNIVERQPNLKCIAGVKRACLCCYLNFILKGTPKGIYNPNVGAFWASKNSAYTLVGYTNKQIEEAFKQIPQTTYATFNLTSLTELNADSGSEDEVEFDLIDRKKNPYPPIVSNKT